MKHERTVYTTRGCFPLILFSSCNRKNENGYNGSYFYFSFFVWGLEKRKRMLSYPFSIFYYEIENEKRKDGIYTDLVSQVIFFSWRKVSIRIVFHSCTASWSSRSPPTKFVPLSDRMTLTCPWCATASVRHWWMHICPKMLPFQDELPSKRGPNTFSPNSGPLLRKSDQSNPPQWM